MPKNMLMNNARTLQFTAKVLHGQGWSAAKSMVSIWNVSQSRREIHVSAKKDDHLGDQLEYEILLEWGKMISKISL